MDLIEAIRGRRAVRDYTAEPVDEATIRRLIDAAVQAPSAVNRQDWNFVVVTDRARLRRIADAAKAHMLAQMDRMAMPEGLRAMLAGPDFDIFYGAPVLVVICATSEDGMARSDCCLAAENLMLAARSEALGSCWIGFAEAWLAQGPGRAELGIAEGHVAVAPIILGHPKAWPPAPGRRAADIRWIRS